MLYQNKGKFAKLLEVETKTKTKTNIYIYYTIKNNNNIKISNLDDPSKPFSF